MTKCAAPAQLALCLALACLAGCGSPERVNVHNAEGYLRMPREQVAVLQVTAEPFGRVHASNAFWGIMDQRYQQRALAEILAHVASETGGINVIPPIEAEDRLRAAGLELTYEPSPGQLEDYVRALACESYLSAHVEKLSCVIFVFGSRAEASILIAGHVPGEDQPLWSVHTRCRAWGIDMREAACAALIEAFETLESYRTGREERCE